MRTRDQNNLGGLALEIKSIKQADEILKEIIKLYSNSDEYSMFVDGQGNKANLFFRGQDQDYQESNNIAGLFRNNHIGKELYYIRQYEIAFQNSNHSEKSPSNLQKLIYMQHYGYQTRLLDITSCFWVALYFATCKNISKDGVVYCFPNFVTPTAYQDKGVISQKTQRETQSENTSLDVSTALAYLQPSDKDYIYKKSVNFTRLIENNTTNLSSDDRKEAYRQMYSTLSGITDSNALEDLEQEIRCEDYVSSLPTHIYEAYQLIKPAYDQLANSLPIHRLKEIMKDDNCQTCEKPIDFTKLFNECFFVTVHQTNPRIIAQHGQFLFQTFPETTSNSKVQCMLTQQYDPQKIWVPASSKKSIQAELKRMKYSRETLFPAE